MYNGIHCELYTAAGEEWEVMARDLLAISAGKRGVIRLVFFMGCADHDEYVVRKKELERLVAGVFEFPQPLVSLVGQRPLVGEVVLEVHSLDAMDTAVVHEVATPWGRYLRIEADGYREVVGSGICGNSPNFPVCAQSQQIFENIQRILVSEDMEWGDIVRQWNYLENITELSGGGQCYQDFNEVRSHFYSASQWLHGYPAATGIGTQSGGIQVDFNAVKGDVRIVPLDNDWQTAAHVYSDDVLIGCDAKKGTPKFERAKLISAGRHGLVYVSGTAAIRGEDSVAGEILAQAEITMENILHLIEVEEAKTGVSACHGRIELLRVYLKNEEDVISVKEWMDRTYPCIPASYLHAEVCRKELLIEIEGIVHL